MPAFPRRFSFKDYPSDRWPQSGPRWSRNVAWPCDPSASNSGSLASITWKLQCKLRSGAVVESAGTHPVESGFLWRHSESNQDPSLPGNARKSRSLYLPRYRDLSNERSVSRASQTEIASWWCHCTLVYAPFQDELVRLGSNIEYILVHCVLMLCTSVIWSTDYSCLFRTIQATARYFIILIVHTRASLGTREIEFHDTHGETWHGGEILTKL